MTEDEMLEQLPIGLRLKVVQHLNGDQDSTGIGVTASLPVVVAAEPPQTGLSGPARAVVLILGSLAFLTLWIVVQVGRGADAFLIKLRNYLEENYG